MAAHRCEADLTPSSSFSGTSSFAAMTIRATPPTSLKYGSFITVATTAVKRMRSSTAAPAPRIMPQRRCGGATPRHAIATTNALSPDNNTLIQMISLRASQKCGWWISVLNCVNTAPIAEGSKNSKNQFNPTSTIDRASLAIAQPRGVSGGYLSQIRKERAPWPGLQTIEGFCILRWRQTDPTIRTNATPSAEL